MPVGLLGVGVVGVLAFTSLSSAREAQTQTSPTSPATPSVALRNLTAPPPSPAPVPQIVQTAVVTPPAPAPAAAADANWRAPVVVVDLGDAHATGGAGPKPGAAGGDDPHATGDERFAARMSSGADETVQARQLHNLNRLVPQGAMIPAVLETAVDSDLPGSVRAVVSRDIRGFDGTQVLVPRGSTLIGQYRSAAAIGQTRAFVVWSRLITPTGVSVEISSPATDTLGRGGLDGETNGHFFKRFGSSILLSVISQSINVLANRTSDHSNNTAIAIGSPTEASRLAEIALQKQIDIPTTIRIPPGQSVQVFVARDLDFSAVAALGR
jgi:type IV secretion system protein VirB10